MGSKSLKTELGLGEPKPLGTGEQANKFKTDFQAKLGKVNTNLQYTAAHAEEAKHKPEAGKRDKVSTAYQSALGKIDPANPSAAQGAIDKVLSAVEGLGSAAEAFKDKVEKAFNAWSEKEGDFDVWQDKIREMVEWGHEKGEALQKVAQGVAEKAKAKKYEESLTVFDGLNGKAEPLYEDFLKQKEAQKTYDGELPGQEPEVEKTKDTCENPDVQAKQQEIAKAWEEMKKLAGEMRFVEALEILNKMPGLLKAYFDEIQKVKKCEYEAALAALQPKLKQASASKHESLKKLDQEIVSLQGQMEASAKAENYIEAKTHLDKLSGLVDKKISEGSRIDRKIIGSAQKARADKQLESLSEEDRKRFNKLADAAKTPEELDYLTKALASKHPIGDIEKFAKKINGKSKEWMQNNLKLTGDSSGKGVKQQWKMSCNATTTQAVRGELDPIYALKLHEENKDVTKAKDSDATKVNPKLAQEQKDMLESPYAGGVAGLAGVKGEATNRGDKKNAAGRWADDLLNNQSDVTGVKYATKKVAGSYDKKAAMADIEDGLKKGHPVPIVVGNSAKGFSHYVLVTGRNEGPPPSWTIHDPGSGKTTTTSVKSIKDGTARFGSYKQITAVEDPSVKK